MVRHQIGLAFIRQMLHDVRKSPIHDMVLESSDDLRIILTLAADFLSPATSGLLRAGSFFAIGKVTRVLTEGEEINLTRRTVMGATRSDMVREVIVESLKGTEGIELETFDPIIGPPALQPLPLAVFV